MKCKGKSYNSFIKSFKSQILPHVICDAVAHEISYSIEKSIDHDRIKKYLLVRFEHTYNNDVNFRIDTRKKTAVKIVRNYLYEWCRYGNDLENVMNDYCTRHEIVEETMDNRTSSFGISNYRMTS